MKFSFHIVDLKKKIPLRISRGLKSGSRNLFLNIKDGIYSAWGESSPGKTEGADSPMIIQKQLENFISDGIKNLSIYELYDRSLEMKIAPCAYASLDMALWDLTSKKANIPLYRYLGLPKPSKPTSVTIGISHKDVIKKKISVLLEENKFKSLKIKLGNPDGIEADKEMFSEIYQNIRDQKIDLRVDANGGWDVNETIKMMNWLSVRNVEYVEQPLKEGMENELKYICKNKKLPIYLDESCRFANQIPKWAEFVDGVNLKLMKSGGITEGLRILNTAKAHGLKTMIGCMSESSVSIAASASISGIVDYIDLDSHYNLDPDPSTGLKLLNGITSLSDQIGHGAKLKKEYHA